MDVHELSLMFRKDSPLGRSQELENLISQILNDERVVYSKDPYGDKLRASAPIVPRIISTNPGEKSKRIRQVPSYHSFQSGVINQGCRENTVKSTTPQTISLIPRQECGFGHKSNNTAKQEVTVKNKTCTRTEPVTDECYVSKSVDYVEIFTDLSRKQMQAGSTENQMACNNDKPGQFIYPPVYQVYLKGKNPFHERRHFHEKRHCSSINTADKDVENEASTSLDKVQQVKGIVNTYVDKEATSLFNNDQRASNGHMNKSMGREETTSLVKVQHVKGTVIKNTGREATTFIEKVLQSCKDNTAGNNKNEATIANKAEETYKGNLNKTTDSVANKTRGSVVTSFIDRVERSEFSGCFSGVQNKSCIMETDIDKRPLSRDVCPLCGQSWEGFISRGIVDNHVCDQIDTITEHCDNPEPMEKDENDSKFPKKVPIEIGKLGEEEIERMIAALVEANQVFKEFPRTDEPNKQQLMRAMSSYLETKEASSGSSSGGLEDPLTRAETRRRVLEHSIKYIELKISESVRFAKKIPGFTALSLEDQANLIRESRTESAIVGGMRGINADKKVFSTHEGGFFSMEDMKLVFDETLLKEKIILSTKIARLNLSREEEAILRAITITATDRCKLQVREQVEDLHNRLMSCLIYVIKKQGTGAGAISRRLGHLTDVLCSCRNVTEVDLVQVKKIFLEWPNYSQYKLVEEFLD